MELAFLPSPPSPYLTVGPLMLHGYALMVVLGVITAIAIGRHRWNARGGDAGAVLDIAMVAVPFGILGGRLYHVITSWQLYFGQGRNPVEALYVWQGGLGIWGAIAGGALGAWIATRRRGIAFTAFADALAPAVLVGQAIGRIGCWFNQELYGRPTTLPWGLEIDPANRPAATPDAATYHPTFAYEAAWNLGAAALVIWAERRFRLDRGRVLALYVAAYTAGRGWIEMLRVDPANHLGLRLNVWTSLLLFLAAVAFLVVRRRPAPTAPAPTVSTEATPPAEEQAAPAPVPSDTDTDTAPARKRTALPGRAP
ncbi:MULTISPECIES: prolipoprotein diacylglyceryl transferase [Streptomyces]|uniref:Phosphatidylglycerol--prolipoprotein diacylglyceryl transferase n=1 Tax=Streptomyces zinciresistens K42 TaxID=700597 RepID=G2G5U0_9ACTN|nr:MULTISPECIES: prolipoprotein diacylglyceryl transferase [Streptomyces]EGX61029.1 prolipoprotein diacylglyceryl transferase [Streptomyces zinciresistens K42]MDT9696556.1 prolipoprotein diacylglyceryl transferase [Streptomyces sp. P17]